MARSRPVLAIVDLSAPGWTAGASYTEGLARSLVHAGARDRFDIVALGSAGRRSTWATELSIPTHECSPDWRTDAERVLKRVVPRSLSRSSAIAARLAGAVIGRTIGERIAYEAEAAGASVVIPVLGAMRAGSFRKIGWIPDFQHVHEPSFFSAADRAMRDADFTALANEADRVILSSAWAKQHFDAFAPRVADKGFQASFPSLFAFEPLPEKAGQARVKYRLPERYALIVNQVWRHKNHRLAIEGVAAARARGVDVPLVLVGTPIDHRDPSNVTMSTLLQRIAELGVHDLVHVLGSVSREDLVDLTRGAAVCIQPSRFEGWSTTVEDAKALGRPLICSDLPVHREQAPKALGFFGVDDAPALADVLVNNWSSLAAGPDLAREREHVAAELAVADRFGATLLAACLA